VDLELVDRLVLVNQAKEKDFRVDENGVMRFRDRVCVSGIPELQRKILKEGRMSSLCNALLLLKG